MAKYNPRIIERKWQRAWEKNQTFKAEIDTSKPKYYILDMFPYPSGAGLHVGHVTGYTATDILARYKRQKGFNVLHPMGWDSFGLPAEQYAIRTGIHPAETTKKNIETYRRQLKGVGFSYDWSREIATSDPDYYKWTQWIFTRLFEKGLAYEEEAPVNFCPALGTVVANEEIENGKTVIGAHPVERRPLRQWILKITAYAEQLIDDLDLVDWPDYLKRLQINWIGKSTGVEMTLALQESTHKIRCYTTRPDTIFGLTYVVLAPEHALVSELTTPENQAAVEAYCKEALAKSDLQRTDLAKTKSGVFTGSYARNPVTCALVPVWIADYVLAHVGTGAVIGVPGNCERDHDFARVYSLEIIPTVALDDPDHIEGSGTMINSKNDKLNLNGLSVPEAKEKAIDWLVRQGLGARKTNYKLRDWLFSRQRYWGEPIPIVQTAKGEKRALALDELPLLPPHVEDYSPSPDGQSPLVKAADWLHIVNPITGETENRETNTMPQWAGSCWYYLRFLDPHNAAAAWSEEAEKYWMPVDMYVGGAEHAVLHLLYARFWHKVLYDCGLVSTKEPFQCLRNQGLVVAHAYKKDSGSYVDPLDVVKKEGKFFEKGTDEPLTELLEKMSKSKLNGVSPDEIIEEFGADSLRLYEMFMSPFDREKIWNTEAMLGVFRFLNRFYDLCDSKKVSDHSNPKALHLALRLLHGVEGDLERMQFNTAIAKMMEFVNAFSPLESYPKEALLIAIQALYAFAPHIACELWEKLGGKGALEFAPLPEIDPKMLEESDIDYIVQVNGKHRGTFKLAKGLSEMDLRQIVTTDPGVAKYLQGNVRKVIFVPNRLINFVVG